MGSGIPPNKRMARISRHFFVLKHSDLESIGKKRPPIPEQTLKPLDGHLPPGRSTKNIQCTLRGVFGDFLLLSIPISPNMAEKLLPIRLGDRKFLHFRQSPVGNLPTLAITGRRPEITLTSVATTRPVFNEDRHNLHPFRIRNDAAL